PCCFTHSNTRSAASSEFWLLKDPAALRESCLSTSNSANFTLDEPPLIVSTQPVIEASCTLRGKTLSYRMANKRNTTRPSFSNIYVRTDHSGLEAVSFLTTKCQDLKLATSRI